jgi:hypothetical protein
MVLGKLASEAPGAYALIHQVRHLRRRARMARALQRAGWFGAGVAAGGGLALLLSPRTGPEMRERLSERVRRARDYVVGEEEAPRAARRSGSHAA